jgi:hypothetical protein
MDLRNDPPATAANLLEQRVSDPDVAAAAFDNRPPSAANLSERRVSEQQEESNEQRGGKGEQGVIGWPAGM